MVREIPLTQGKVALVDDESYQELNRYKWTLAKRENGNAYAVRETKTDGSCRQVYMHRVLLGVGPGESVDHRDGNGLNNTFSNLRRCNQQQNGANQGLRQKQKTSQYKGVYWDKAHGFWCASIGKLYGHRFLGFFSDECEAARAYDVAAMAQWGEFARLNHAGRS
jgi:hypothetical protein